MKSLEALKISTTRRNRTCFGHLRQTFIRDFTGRRNLVNLLFAASWHECALTLAAAILQSRLDYLRLRLCGT